MTGLTLLRRESRITSKKALLGIALLALVLSISASLSAAPVEIKIGYYESSGGLGITGKTMQALIDTFMQANPGIKVTTSVGPYGAFFQKLPVELVAGTGPDVWLSDGVLIDQYAGLGFALDITNRIQSMGNPNDYFGLEANRTPEGRIFAFPQGLQSSAFFYNKDMFQAAGLPVPNDTWTYDDVRRTAKKLTRDTDGDNVFNEYGFRSFNQITEGWFPIIKAFGGGALDATRRKSRFADPKTLEALSYMIDMIYVDQSSPKPGTDPFSWFPQKLVAMQTGLFVRTFGANQVKLNYDVTSVPAGPAGRFNPVIVNSWIINAQTSKAQQDAAWEWVKFFSGEKAQTVWAELGEAVPVNRKVAVTTFMRAGGQPVNRMAFVNGLDYATPLDPNPVWSNWQTAATKALDPAFKGTINIREAAANADKNVQQALDDYYLRKK